MHGRLGAIAPRSSVGRGRRAGPSNVACSGARPDVPGQSRLCTITDLRVHHPDLGVHHERADPSLFRLVEVEVEWT